MAKHKNRRRFGRHSMHGSMGFTPDQFERYKEDARDYYAGRNDYVKSLKVIHEHKTTTEKIEPSDDTMLAVLREAAGKGQAQFQYQYAVALEKLGRKEEASYWCRKASQQGWPGAKEHLKRILDSFKPIVAKPRQVKSLPEIAYFKVQYSQTFEKLCNAPWVIFVSAKDGKGLRLASDFGHEHDVEIKESFKTRGEAVAAGKSYISKWESMRNCEGQAGGRKVL